MGVLRFLKIIIHSYLSLSSQLRNGPDGSAPLLGGRLCGSSPPSVLQTTDNHLFIHFVSDANNEASGFKLLFEAHSQGRIFTSSLSQEMFQCRKVIISKCLVTVDKFWNWRKHGLDANRTLISEQCFQFYAYERQKELSWLKGAGVK